MSPRDYSRFGLLFSRGGKWNNEQVISNDFVNETFTSYWDETPGWWTNEKRGYSLHWWISKNDEQLLTTPFDEFERSIRDQLTRLLSPGGFDASEDIPDS